VDPGGPAPLFFKSADGGKTWAPMVKGMPKRLGAEVHLDPEAATTLYAGQAANAFGGNTGPGGGVSVSTDSGASWTLSPVDAAAGANDVVLAMAVVSSIAGAPAPPAFSVNGVENGASFQPGIPANSWVTILGTNLATQTGDWSNAIVNGNLPTTLNGVSVSMGGMPAYIYYTSPGQLNVLAPDLAAGAVAVTVTTAAGTSSALTVGESVRSGLLLMAWQSGGGHAAGFQFRGQTRNFRRNNSCRQARRRPYFMGHWIRPHHSDSPGRRRGPRDQ